MINALPLIPAKAETQVARLAACGPVADQHPPLRFVIWVPASPG
jgi:hypothetical protein